LIPAPLHILDIPIHPVSPGELVATLIDWGRGPMLRKVYNVNVHAMNLAAEEADFKRFLQNADLVFCDGFGVKWGGKILGQPIPFRMTPPDWIDDFATQTIAAGQSVFALGDEDGIAKQFQDELRTRHPGYLDAGSHHGFFQKSGPENEAVIELINRSGATHLLVGFGMPLQERWIEANAGRLNVKVVLPVGALFRWYVGYETRAPRWMTDHGLEWLARFLRHPIQHFRRYAVGNPRFLWRVLRSRLSGNKT
jgi:N-acetylglucosaminyldiphosphoundecaprenol N-acetyl-beta-D-mannosaminyltransferase